MDKATNKSQSITITASSNLSESDINAAIKDAEKYAEEDKKRKAIIDAKNGAEQLIFAMDKFITENGEKLADEDKDAIAEAIKTARTELETAENEEQVKTLVEKLTSVSDPIFTKFYQQNPDVADGAVDDGSINPDDISFDGGMDGSVE